MQSWSDGEYGDDWKSVSISAHLVSTVDGLEHTEEWKVWYYITCIIEGLNSILISHFRLPSHCSLYQLSGMNDAVIFNVLVISNVLNVLTLPSDHSEYYKGLNTE